MLKYAAQRITVKKKEKEKEKNGIKKIKGKQR